ncbi:MAG TPA: Hsp33 family molecular chaperone HslO [Sphingobacteriaceae bacterium]|nr:Hsp33 family molecular chaperone HslO [Sphingobacteriaceae bacterium]
MLNAGDYVARATADGGKVRVLAARSTRLVAEAQRRHGALPTAAAALGRVLTGAALMGALLKEDNHTVTVRIRGTGPLGAIIADSDGRGHVRGYVQNPQVNLPLNSQGKLDVSGAVGLPGEINVVWDLHLRQPYSGTAPLATGEIGEDFTAYFWRSEQTPSLVALGVLVGPGGQVMAAGGVLAQLLPGSSAHWAETLTENARQLAGISRLIAGGAAPEDLIERTLAGFEGVPGHRLPLVFQCRCSRERCRRLLASLGADELRDMLATDGQAEMECHFCRQKYLFDAEELGQLLALQS